MLKFIKLFIFCCLVHIVLCAQKNCDREIPNESKPSECCRLPAIIPEHLRAECVKEFASSYAKGTDNKNLTIELKVAQCIFQKAQTSEGDSINVDRVRAITILTLAGHDEIVEEFQEALVKCKRKEYKMLDDFHKKVKEHNFTYDNSVNPVYALYISCIGTRLFGDCPDNYKTRTDSCKKTRDYLDDCHYQYPYPLFVNFNKI